MRNLLFFFFAVFFTISSQNVNAQELTVKETIDKISQNKWYLRRYESPDQFYNVPEEYRGTFMAFSPNGKVYYYKRGENEANKPRYDYSIANDKITITSHEGTKEVFDFEYRGYNIYFTVRSGNYKGFRYVWEKAEENLQIPASTAQSASTTNASASSEYNFATVEDLAAALNKGIRSARINFQDPSYSFNITGQTSFTYSSIEFYTKNNKMYIKMNIPQNGRCDYGMKETEAIITGQYGLGGDRFYIAFQYEYSCNDIDYKTIYANFYMKNKAHFEATQAAAKRLLKKGYL